jgi:hypothetical protein
MMDEDPTELALDTCSSRSILERKWGSKKDTMQEEEQEIDSGLNEDAFAMLYTGMEYKGMLRYVAGTNVLCCAKSDVMFPFCTLPQ